MTHSRPEGGHFVRDEHRQPFTPFAASFWQQACTLWHLRQTNLFGRKTCTAYLWKPAAPEKQKTDPPAMVDRSRMANPVATRSIRPIGGVTVKKLARFRPDARPIGR